jgi:TPR repeat protein
VAVDATEAARWYRLGADRNDVRAQCELGQLYFNETGVTRDYSSAYVWFSLAALQAPLADNREGLLELCNIATARMTPEEVADAARLAAAWKPAESGVGRWSGSGTQMSRGRPFYSNATVTARPHHP